MQQRKPNTFIATRRPRIVVEVAPLLWKLTVGIVLTPIMAKNVSSILESSISSRLFSCLRCSMSPLTLSSRSCSSSSSLDPLPSAFLSRPELSPDALPSPLSRPWLSPDKLPLPSPTQSWLTPDLLPSPSASQHSLPSPFAPLYFFFLVSPFAFFNGSELPPWRALAKWSQL